MCIMRHMLLGGVRIIIFIIYTLTRSVCKYEELIYTNTHTHTRTHSTCYCTILQLEWSKNSIKPCLKSAAQSVHGFGWSGVVCRVPSVELKSNTIHKGWTGFVEG